MKIRHYYHCYAAGAWSAPVRDHLTALGRAGLDDMAMTVGLAGPQRDRQVAREMITLRCQRWSLPEPVRWIEADEGWEQVTLRVIREDALATTGDYEVLYAHTKGAHDDSDMNAAWRRSMTRKLVYGWEECTELLAGGYDTAGCHLLTPEGYRDHHPRMNYRSMVYGGNFWWARASYLRTLPLPGSENRHQGEEWIGLGHPKAADLLPGWPDYP